MEANQLLSLLLCLVLFIIGVGASSLLNLETTPAVLGILPGGGLPGAFVAAGDMLLLVLAVFIFSTLMFGFFACFIFLPAGFMLGGKIVEHPLPVILKAVPLFIAAYAGIMAGNYLWKDLNGKDNFFSHMGRIAAFVAAAVVLGLAAGALSPFLPNLAQLTAIAAQLWASF